MADKSIELVEGLIVKPGTHGRRTYSRQAKRALVQMCKAPGVSVAGLALSHGINANLLRRWISQHDAVDSNVTTPTFMIVRMHKLSCLSYPDGSRITTRFTLTKPCA